jgi:hypothetical protein
MADEDDKINVPPERPLHTLNEPGPKPGSDLPGTDYPKPDNAPSPGPIKK